MTALLLKAKTVYPVTAEPIADGEVLIVDGKIKAVGKDLDRPDGCEVKEFPDGVLTPAFIEVHAHLSVFPEPTERPGIQNDGNEGSDPITPDMRASDSINPFDRAFPQVAAAGFATAYITPGSANLCGGTGIAVKLRGTTAEEMIIPGTEAMKFALGENPKFFHGHLNKRAPYTRMANAAMLRNLLAKAKRYDAKWTKAERNGDTSDLDYDPELEALRKVVRGEMRCRFHAHAAQDIETVIRLAHEFDLDYVIEHVTEGHKILDFLEREKPYLVVGPNFMSPYKKETWDVRQDNAKLLAERGLTVSLTADTGSDTKWLPSEVGRLMRFGLSFEDALKGVTVNPAETLGLQDRMGQLKEGMDGDIAVFDGHPFSNFTSCVLTVIDGDVVFEK